MFSFFSSNLTNMKGDWDENTHSLIIFKSILNWSQLAVMKLIKQIYWSTQLIEVYISQWFFFFLNWIENEWNALTHQSFCYRTIKYDKFNFKRKNGINLNNSLRNSTKSRTNTRAKCHSHAALFPVYFENIRRIARLSHKKTRTVGQFVNGIFMPIHLNSLLSLNLKMKYMIKGYECNKE